MAILDPDNPYRYMQVPRPCAQRSPKAGAAAHIDALAKKYLGKDKYPFAKPGECASPTRSSGPRLRDGLSRVATSRAMTRIRNRDRRLGRSTIPASP